MTPQLCFQRILLLLLRTEPVNYYQFNSEAYGLFQDRYASRQGMMFFEDFAVKKLYTTLYRPLCLYAFQLLHDYDSSEDIVQDCFLHLVEKETRLLNARAYLYAAVRNRCINELRKKTLVDGIDDNLPLADEDTSLQERAERHAALWNAIDRLPRQRRLMLLMSKQQKLKYSEIAGILGVSEQTVKNQISRALKTLRKTAGDGGTI